MKKAIAIFSVVISASIPAGMHAQCTDQVTDTAGTSIVSGVTVTVTSAGTVDVNSVYCPSTMPYFIGYDYSTGSSFSGSYTFTFSPPVGAVTLNFSGLSGDPANEEHVVLTVNNAHYAIPSPGTANGCDPMAVLTPAGDVGPCANCGVSGWNGTTITGPITTLTVTDSVLFGAPNGAIFSLFICAQDPKTGIDEASASGTLQVYPNPAADQLTVTGAVYGTPYCIADATGRIVLNGTIGSDAVNISSLAAGLYAVILPDAGAVRFIKQ
jgi:hypothetical protein